jgi:hypothetical protein
MQNTNINKDDNLTEITEEPEVVSESLKRASFKQLMTLLARYKEYTTQIEAQVNHLQEMLEADQSVVKEITLNNSGITISIKFNNGIPSIPMDQAFAVNVAATKLIQQLLDVSDDSSKVVTHKPANRLTPPKLISLGVVSNIVTDNKHLEQQYEA